MMRVRDGHLAEVDPADARVCRRSVWDEPLMGESVGDRSGMSR
jgi:hypothetical protein